MTLDGVLKILEIFTKIGILAGGVFTGWQYLESKQVARITRSFELIQLLNQNESNPVAEARAALSAELRGQPELRRLTAMPMPEAAARALHAELAHTLITNSRNGKGLSTELDRLLDFFNQLQICIEKDLCDAPTAQAFLGGYAGTLWLNFQPYIEAERPFLPGYGSGLHRFVTARTGA